MIPARKVFSIGPLDFRLDGNSGFVRNICFHGCEVLRGIYPAVRDRDWATLRPLVEPLEIDATSDRLIVRIKARTVGPEVDLAWTAEMEAHGEGWFKYTWRGIPQSTCTTNRTGLCVLHSAEVAGAPCEVEHTDGSQEAGWFPSQISPHQPFRDIRALKFVASKFSEVVVRFGGETFEMEDQRNWTDASFKTYCRPLAWQRPYTLKTGETIEHSVAVELRGIFEPRRSASTEAPVEPIPLRLPRIGVTLPGPIPRSLRERMHALRPAHVRVEAIPENLAATLDWAQAEAMFLECELVVAITGVERLGSSIASLPSSCSVHLFDAAGNRASGETLAAWRQAGYSSLGTGTLQNFVELNRNRPPADGAHTHIVFGINAQVHAQDDDSILETLTQHAAVARTAHRIAAGRPIVVGPISLGRRPDSVDPRLRTEFGAQWLLESLRQLARAECVESATYFHAYGPYGFMHEAQISPVERVLTALAGRDTLPADFSIPG